jgi:hypothetical protein
MATADNLTAQNLEAAISGEGYECQFFEVA